MNRRAIWIASIALIVLIGGAIRSAKDKRTDMPNFRLVSAQRVTFNNGVNLVNVADWDRVLSGLSTGQKEIWNRPDQVLLLHPKGLSNPHYLSIFLKEGYVYDGFYLDAWTECMTGNKSQVFLLNDTQMQNLSALLKESDLGRR